ncbi:MAG: hypothetical protein AAFR95_08400 [Bacteroidota bacterium]
MLAFRSLVLVLVASLLAGPATVLLCPHGTAIEAAAMHAAAHGAPHETHGHAEVPPCHRAPAPEAPQNTAQHLPEAPLPDTTEGEVCLMPCCDAAWATATPDIRFDGSTEAMVVAWLPAPRVQSGAHPVPSPTESPPLLRRHVMFCRYLI